MGKNKQNVLVAIVKGKARGLVKEKDKWLYTEIYEEGKDVIFLTGTYEFGRPEGMYNAVIGKFISDDGQEFIVYGDMSINRKEDITSAGYPTEEFLNSNKAVK